jgi:hypothetical protein
MRKIHHINGLVSTSILFSMVMSAGAMAEGDPVMDGDSPNGDYGGLHCWLRGDALVNGGTPADGTAVTSWGDSGHQGRDLTRVSGDANQQAVYTVDGINGHPALTFNGNDYIWAAKESDAWGTLTNSRTIFVVASAGAVNGGYVFDSSSSAGRNAFFVGETANPTEWIAYPGGCCTWTCGEATVDETVVVALHLESGASSVYINGEHMSDNDFTLSSLAGIILGSRYNTANALTGQIAEVLVYDLALTSADREAVQCYLLEKYVPAPGCIEDLDDTGAVDGADLATLLGAWGHGGSGDFDGSGIVDGADLATLLGAWGPCPGPCPG